MAITGAIRLSGNPDFAEVGSTMQISFDRGEPIGLVSEGASWREWSVAGGKQTTELFRLSRDPGELLNGNTLCGDNVRYLVFSEGDVLGETRLLEVAVFDSDTPPFDINSDGLCATFTYVVD